MVQQAVPTPHNLQTERALLGVIMARNESLFEVSHIVTASDFFEPYHGELYNLMRDQIEASREVSPSSLLHDMAQDRDIGGVQASKYLAELLEESPPPAMARQLATNVRDLSGKRQLIELFARGLEEVEGAPASLTWTEILGHTEEEISRLLRSSNEAGLRQIAEIGDSVMHRIQEAATAERALGLDIGLASAQDLTGPFMPGRLYFLGGASGSGKSALAQQICEYVAAAGNPTLMVQIEMSDEEVAERSLARATGIDASKIEQAAITVDEHQRLVEENEARRQVPFYIDASTAPNLGAIRGKAMRMKRLRGLSLLAIDHLLYIEKPVARMGDVEAVRPNLQGLKRLAKDLQIPVLVLGPMKLEFSAGPVRRPMLSDCFGGSAIEHESDVAFLVHREDYMLKRRMPKTPTQGAPEREQTEYDLMQRQLLACEGKAEIILAKRRGGRGFGDRLCYFDETRTRFEDRAAPAGHAMQAGPPIEAYEGDGLF